MGIIPILAALLIVVIIAFIYERTKYEDRVERKKKNRKSDDLKVPEIPKKQSDPLEDAAEKRQMEERAEVCDKAERKSTSGSGEEAAPILAVTPPYAYEQLKQPDASSLNNVQQQEQETVKPHPVVEAATQPYQQQQNNQVPEKLSIESVKAAPSDHRQPQQPAFVSAGAYPVETHNPAATATTEANMPSQQNLQPVATATKDSSASKKKLKNRSPKNRSKQQESSSDASASSQKSFKNKLKKFLARKRSKQPESSDASTSSKKVMKKDRQKAKNKSANDSSKKIKKRKQQRSRGNEVSSK